MVRCLADNDYIENEKINVRKAQEKTAFQS
jgi:hypothetical protein